MIATITRNAACLIAVTAFASPALAQVEIYSNLGPGDDFDMVGGNLVLGEDDLSIGNIDQAIAFTVGPVNTYITSVELGLTLSDGADQLDVLLLADAGGSPGATLLTMSATGLPSPGPGLLQVGPPMLFELEAGATYWIAADASGDTDITWHFNTTGATGKAGRSGFPVGPWNVNDEAVSLALRVSGREVPAPGAAALAGLAGLATSRRRR